MFALNNVFCIQKTHTVWYGSCMRQGRYVMEIYIKCPINILTHIFSENNYISLNYVTKPHILYLFCPIL